MVNSCCVPGCRNEFGCKKNLRMHKFPLTNGRILAKWLKAISRENWHPKEHSKVCSDHFVLDDYTSPCSNRLKPDAIPSCMLPVAVQCIHEEQEIPDSKLDIICEIPMEEATYDLESACSRNTECISIVEDSTCSKEIAQIKKVHAQKDILLKKKIRSLQKKIQRQTKKMNEMTNRIAELTEKSNETRNNVNIFEALQGKVSSEMIRLLKEEVVLNNHYSQGRRFSEDRKKFALTLFHHSPEAYKFLGKYITLPAPRTLRSWITLQNNHFSENQRNETSDEEIQNPPENHNLNLLEDQNSNLVIVLEGS